MAAGSGNLLVINSGSSSLKFALFSDARSGTPTARYRGRLTGIGERGVFQVSGDTHVTETPVTADNHHQALSTVLAWLSGRNENILVNAIGHRVVHGGLYYDAPTRVSTELIERLQSLVPLAPNHLPANLLGITELQRLRPDVPQVACFDTAFHAAKPRVEQYFALPQRPQLEAVRRYGFHGLSYEYIASVLPDRMGAKADGKIIVAHLGHGASLCAMRNRCSVATTMTFTPLDGIPMGTRCGAVDAAVVLYLLEQGMTVEAVSNLLYFQSGLLGVSALSDDIRTLLESSEEQARFAVDLFVHHVVRAIGSLAAALGGIDALVFTAGIGEHSATVRAAIAAGCDWLGVQLDEEANARHQARIDRNGSRVEVRVIPTDEEYVIARHTHACLARHKLNRER